MLLLCRDCKSLADFLCFKLQLAKAEKLKPMEVELKRLEDLGDAIVNDFAYMRQREQEMRDTNGKEILTLFVVLFRLYLKMLWFKFSILYSLFKLKQRRIRIKLV